MELKYFLCQLRYIPKSGFVFGFDLLAYFLMFFGFFVVLCFQGCFKQEQFFGCFAFQFLVLFFFYPVVFLVARLAFLFFRVLLQAGIYWIFIAMLFFQRFQICCAIFFRRYVFDFFTSLADNLIAAWLLVYIIALFFLCFQYQFFCAICRAILMFWSFFAYIVEIMFWFMYVVFVCFILGHMAAPLVCLLMLFLLVQMRSVFFLLLRFFQWLDFVCFACFFYVCC